MYTYIQTDYTWYTTYYSKISVLGYGYFGTIFQKNPSETWAHPLTSIVNLDFFFTLQITS